MSTELRPDALVARLAAGHALEEWWPTDRAYHEAHGTDPRDETIIGAILVQNTSWQQVQRALSRLKGHDALDLASIRALPADALADLVRSAGFVQRKPATLQALAGTIEDEGGVAALAEQADDDPDPVRRLFLEVHGIGEETADAILAYALDAPVFVVDAYTRRLMHRLQILVPDENGDLRDPLKARYRDVQRWWMRGLPRDAHVLRLAHAAIVHHAQNTCRSTPRCSACVFETACPHAT